MKLLLKTILLVTTLLYAGADIYSENCPRQLIGLFGYYAKIKIPNSKDKCTDVYAVFTTSDTLSIRSRDADKLISNLFCDSTVYAIARCDTDHYMKLYDMIFGSNDYEEDKYDYELFIKQFRSEFDEHATMEKISLANSENLEIKSCPFWGVFYQETQSEDNISGQFEYGFTSNPILTPITMLYPISRKHALRNNLIILVSNY